MKSQKQLTLQIINTANNIVSFIDSGQYRQQVGDNDINSQNSPYKVGDYTVGESIDNLKKICRIIISKEDLIDTINYDIRNNVNTYLQNLHSWLMSNVIGNWNNIISYTTTIQQWLASSGISIFSESSRDIDKKLKNINIKNEELNEIKSLRSELEEIKKAGTALGEAKDIIEYARLNLSVKATNEYITSTKDEIGDLQKQARDLLGDSSHYALIKHFNDVSIQYRQRAYGVNFESFDEKDERLEKGLKFLKNTYKFLFSGTIKYLLYSIVIFALNIFLVFKLRTDLQIQLSNEILELIGNGLIRLTCISPGLILLSFVFSEYKRLNSLREKYEFKSAISSTFEGHIIMLDKYLDKQEGIDNQTRNDFIGTTVTEIFSNPVNEEVLHIKEKDGLKIDDFKKFIDSAKENVSLFEKTKDIMK